MPTENLQIALSEAVAAFAYPGNFVRCTPFGGGHINDTFLVIFQENGIRQKYTLQRMNKRIFKNPEALMENLMGISSFLKNKILSAGGDPHREALDFMMSKTGTPYYCDSFGEYWRSYRFIDDVYTMNVVESTRDFYESAVAFGHFQALLSDYPVESLYEIIPDFHNTVSRFAAFQDAIEKDVCKRVDSAKEEVQFYLDREPVAHILGYLQKEGKLPLRVTHNDTKSNNVLMDNATHRGICIIDLDTVMPGLSVNDFGDSIRFGASTAAEDEQDLSKVSCDLEKYEAYVKGFIEGCEGTLTKDEILSLPLGAKVMTYECGMRFLADYLQGDIYFKTAYPEHNLVRARTQMKLVADMEQKWDDISRIIQKYL